MGAALILLLDNRRALCHTWSMENTFGPTAPTSKPIMYVGRVRTDNRFPVTYAFSNGKRIKKLLTVDQLTAERAKGHYTEIAK